MRATSLLPDLPAAVDHVLRRGQLTQPDRAPRMQLLGRVADFRPHSELVAVREWRGRVDVDGRGVHPVRELIADLCRAGHFRVRVPGALLCHVVFRPAERVHGPHGLFLPMLAGVAIVLRRLTLGRWSRLPPSPLVSYPLERWPTPLR